jgi:predicted RNase H-like HicB family nuclease
MELKIVLEEEGGYTVFVPALPGCISQGDTLEKAVRNIKEAILLYLDEY